MLQQLGCHFCTKGCQNPRARGSQGAAARDLPGQIASKTCDPATKRTSSKKSRRRGKAPATRRVTQKWTPSRRPATTARPSSACRRSTRSTGASRQEGMPQRDGAGEQGGTAPAAQREGNRYVASVITKEKLHRPRPAPAVGPGNPTISNFSSSMARRLRQRYS